MDGQAFGLFATEDTDELVVPDCAGGEWGGGVVGRLGSCFA
jgi:hypothetical protein